jgi:MFS family permease
VSQSAPAETLDPTRWRTLFVVAIAQLMIVLDSSIMNIAIPSAKVDLGISDANQQWVITAYTLAFGSLFFWVDVSVITWDVRRSS